MGMTTAVNINCNAKRNRGRGARGREKRSTHRAISHLLDARLDLTTEPKEVTALCDEYTKQRTQIVILSGGDGTIQTFLTENFKHLYRRFAKGNTPIEFAHMMNSMALDPGSDLMIPSIYHKKRGTLNCYADTLGMKGDLERAVENISTAERRYSGAGTRAFPRKYLKVLMLYDKDNPNDLDHISLMTLYADGLVYNFFKEYYRPKNEKGKDASMLTAAQIVARAAGSVALDKLMPRDTALGKMFPNRYLDTILRDVEGKVVVDGETVIGEGDIRKTMAIGTMNASLYGLKPFHRMSGLEEDFRRLGLYFEAFEQETESRLNPREHYFHILVGNPAPADIIKAIPMLLRGKPTEIPDLTDRLAKKVVASNSKNLVYIADGSIEQNGRRGVIEIAYLQPFILLDHVPGA